MSETRKAYSCYTCSEEVTFHGTRVRYNLDGSLHLCKPEDKLAYEIYSEYIRHDNTGWRLTGEDFWKWTQSRDYYNELKEQREREQQRAPEAEAEERRKRAEAEAQRRKAAEEAAEAQRREEQRKQASREKRRAAKKEEEAKRAS